MKSRTSSRTRKPSLRARAPRRPSPRGARASWGARAK